MIKNLDLIIKVSKLYYEKNLNFTEIGNLLKLSRFQVANIIKTAKKTGVVKILIDDKYIDENIKLNELLEKEFGIDRVIVVDNRELPEPEIRKRIGYITANFLNDILKDGDIISLTTSSTVNAIADSIVNKNKIRNIIVIEANGGSNITYSNSVHVLARKFAKVFNATHYSINAPIIVKSKKTRDILLEEKNLKKIFELFNKVKVLIFGIGTFYPKVNKLMIESGDLHKSEFLELRDLNAAGNILYYYYDIEGNFLNANFNGRIICLPKEKLKDIPYRIAVAYGKNKKFGVIGALRTKLVKFLILDSQLAKGILDIKDISKKEFEKLCKKDINFNNYINNI